MIIPKYMKPGLTIGVTATSEGVIKETDIRRFQNAKINFSELGYFVKFTDNVFTADEKGRSSDSRSRAEQFHALIADDDVGAVFAAKGGNYLFEMLDELDFELIKKHPKFIQGYSDNTSLLFAITTKCDIATVYGSNFGDFGMETWELPVQRNYEILTGEETVQHSFPEFENTWPERITGLEGYQCDKKVEWVNARGEEEIIMSGRLLGGCTDVLFSIAGTPYDGMKTFNENYKGDGVIWYMESFLSSGEELMFHLWQLKEMGWFQYAKGFIFGRPMFYQTSTDTGYEKAVMHILDELQVPVIFGADIGHKGPQFAMINGILANIWSAGGKGCIEY